MAIVIHPERIVRIQDRDISKVKDEEGKEV